MALTDEQVRELLKPIDPGRVLTDGKGFAHIAAWDVRRRMNQIFGFGNWSARIDLMELIYEQAVEGTKPRWSVAYRARCTIEIGEGIMGGGGTYTEWAAGDATNYPSRADAHDQAIKTAESQAFKRCAVNLGDQFGLSLYADGSTDATVGEVLGMEHADSHRVEMWAEALNDVDTGEMLQNIVDQIKAADLSGNDKKSLAKFNQGAISRLKTA
jgi:recombination DNA repair RAD52 pathway protein